MLIIDSMIFFVINESELIKQHYFFQNQSDENSPSPNLPSVEKMISRHFVWFRPE